MSWRSGWGNERSGKPRFLNSGTGGSAALSGGHFVVCESAEVIKLLFRFVAEGATCEPREHRVRDGAGRVVDVGHRTARATCCNTAPKQMLEGQGSSWLINLSIKPCHNWNSQTVLGLIDVFGRRGYDLC